MPGFHGPFLVYGMLLTVPFLRMIVRERYGLLRPEAALLLLTALALAAALAAFAWRSIVMHAIAVPIMTALSASAFDLPFLPHPRLAWGSVIAIVAMVAGALIFRLNFYRFAVIFLAGTLAVDVGKAALALPSAQARDASTSPKSAGPRQHIIHVILDEMIGLGSMPSQCQQCQLARASLETTFQQDKFRTYPFAFSNYDFTRHSVLSILTNRVFANPDKYDSRRIVINGAYFNDLASHGYALRLYNCDFVSYTVPKNVDVVVHTYKAADINTLRQFTPTFGGRFKLLLAHFIRSDQFLSQVCGRSLPSRFQPENTWTAALGAQSVWARMLDDIRLANKNTVFFAHLIVPHFPYIYSGDGSIRPPEQWLSFSGQTFFPGDEAAYRQRYEVYGGQMRAVARQLRWFLDRLRTTADYDTSTIIVHGDHGSRLRMMIEGPKGARPNSLFAGDYDYKAAPDERDILNRFGTLLAIKPPRAVASEVVNEEGSVLHFLRKQFSWPSQPGEPDENSVYMRDPRTGRYKGLAMAGLWPSASRSDLAKTHVDN